MNVCNNIDDPDSPLCTGEPDIKIFAVAKRTPTYTLTYYLCKYCFVLDFRDWNHRTYSFTTSFASNKDILALELLL